MSPPASIDLEGFFFKRCPIGRVRNQRLRRKFQNDLAGNGQGAAAPEDWRLGAFWSRSIKSTLDARKETRRRAALL
jgi:hypothetical protein